MLLFINTELGGRLESVFHEPLLFPEKYNSLGSHVIMKCSVTILMSWILFTISAKNGTFMELLHTSLGSNYAGGNIKEIYIFELIFDSHCERGKCILCWELRFCLESLLGTEFPS